METANSLEANTPAGRSEWDSIGEEVPFKPDTVKIRVDETTGKAIKRDRAVEVLRRSVREAKDEQKFGEVEKLADAILDDENGFSSEQKAEVKDIKNSAVYKEEELRANINRKKAELAKKEEQLNENITEYAALNDDNVINKFKNRGKINQLKKDIDSARKETSVLKSQIEGLRTNLISLLDAKKNGSLESATVESEPVLETAAQAQPVQVAEPVPDKPARMNSLDRADIFGGSAEPIRIPVTEVPSDLSAEAPVLDPVKSPIYETYETVVSEESATEEKQQRDEHDEYSTYVLYGGEESDHYSQDPNYVKYLADSNTMVAIGKDHAVDALETRIMDWVDADKAMNEIMKLYTEIMKVDSGFSEEEQNRVRSLMSTPEFKLKRATHDVNRTKRFLAKRNEALALSKEKLNELEDTDLISKFMNRHKIDEARKSLEWIRADVKSAEKYLKAYEEKLNSLKAQNASGPEPMAA